MLTGHLQVPVQDQEQTITEIDRLEEHKTVKKQSKLPLTFFCLISILVLIVFLEIHSISSKIKQKPTIIEDFYEESYNNPSLIIPFQRRTTLQQSEQIISLLQKSIKKYKLQPNLAEWTKYQIINSASQNYRRTITNIDTEIAARFFQEDRDKQVWHKITYGQYIRAVNLLKFNGQEQSELANEAFQENKSYLMKKYELTNDMSEQLPFCVIVPLDQRSLQSNAYYYSLWSIMQQRYTNWKAVVFDRSPEVGMSEQLKIYLGNRGFSQKATFFSGNMLESAGIFYSIYKYCGNEDIVMIVRGSDELIGNEVFRLFNHAYQTKDVSMVYSNYLIERNSSKIYNNDTGIRYKIPVYFQYTEEIIKSNKFRSQKYKVKHLKTFKNGLIRKAGVQLFQNHNGGWHEGPIDSAIEFTTLELSCGKFYYLPEILYRASQKEKESLELVSWVKNLKPYSCKFEIRSESKQNLFRSFDTLHLTQEQFNSDSVDWEEQKKLFDIFHAERVKEMKVSEQIYTNLQGLRKKRQMKPGSGISSQKMIEAIISMQQTAKQLKNTTKAQKVLDYQNKTFEFEQPLCIIVPTYQNRANFRYLYNIESILQQDYINYHLTIIDDASEDGTGEAIKAFIQGTHRLRENQVRIFKNRERVHTMANVYWAAHRYCQKRQIMIVIDGDDELIGNQVFKKISKVYKENHSLVVYSNHLKFQNGTATVGTSRNFDQNVIEKRSFREQLQFFSHLRSYIVELFHSIDIQEFKGPDGLWLEVNSDFAMYYPGLQMACDKITYIPELLYRYRVGTGLNDYEVNNELQVSTVKYLRGRKKYECLDLEPPMAQRP